MCISGGKKCSFFGKFGVFCFLDTSFWDSSIGSQRQLEAVRKFMNFTNGGLSFMRVWFNQQIFIHDIGRSENKSSKKILLMVSANYLLQEVNYIPNNTFNLARRKFWYNSVLELSNTISPSKISKSLGSSLLKKENQYYCHGQKTRNLIQIILITT